MMRPFSSGGITAALLFALGICAHADVNFNVTKYGAKGDGVSLNTVAIQRAIDAAAVHGGTVVFPAGNVSDRVDLCEERCHAADR